MFAVAAAGAPATGITNGDFADKTGAGWTTEGTVSFGAESAVLTGSSDRFLTSLSQGFLLPTRVEKLRFET
jgi:hypothetical protein